jgi:mannose-1-phosphate guanylyltransferase
MVSGEETLGYRLFDETLAHTSVWMAPSARLVGPVMLGAGAVIGEGATLVGPTVIGPGCRVGAGALLSRSVLWSNAHVGERAVLDRCLVADDVTVPAHTTLFNALRAPEGREARSDDPLSLAATNWNGAMFPLPTPAWRHAAA